MSSTVTVIGGVNSGVLTGIVTVPVAGLGSSGTPKSVLQAFLDSESALVTSGGASLFNYDQATSTSFSASGTIPGSGLYEITNTDSVGGTTGGSSSGSYTVGAGYNVVVVQAPGTETVTASDGLGGRQFLLGEQSTVTLNTGNGNSDSIISAGGNDTLNLQSSDSVLVTAGDDRIRNFSGNSVVVMTGSSSILATNVLGYAGSMDIVNAGTGWAHVLGDAGSVTVFAGVGGGEISGGTMGDNSLVGGSGSAILVGAGSGDTLEAGYTSTGGAASITGATNWLYAGQGNETLLASSATGDNLLAAGSGPDLISTDGAGTQYFFGGSGSATMTGSTQSGSNNVYFFGTPTNTGGNDVITNFTFGTDQLFAIDGAVITTVVGSNLGGTPGALVSLSDGTQINLQNIQASQIASLVGGSYIG